MDSRTQPGPEGDSAARNAVLCAGLALGCALLALGWWASRNWRAARALQAPQARTDSAAQHDAALQAVLDSKPGSVRVLVVDAADGAPLAGVEVELFCEEPVRRRFGTQRSDARGEARFESVFAPTVLALARRDERFADCLSLAQGERDGLRTALLRRGSGARVRGRVLDDLGAAIEGAQLSLPDIAPWPNPLRPTPVVARSAADGSFVIERVLNLPRLVTRRDSAGAFAAAMTHVVIEASFHGSVARLPCSLLPCDDAQAADLVLLRPPTFQGRVLDPRRRPLGGVLVSLHPQRAQLLQANLHVVDPAGVEQGLADLPGMPRFQLLEGEALTAQDGSFVLSGTPRRQAVLVACADGRLQDNPLGTWNPGETRAGLEFVLAEREVLRLRLFDPEGAPILGVSPGTSADAAAGGVRVLPVDPNLQAAWASSRAELVAELSDGRSLRQLAMPLGDGSFSFALPTPLSSIERFSVQAPGFKPLTREVRGRLRSELASASEHLERLDSMQLELALSGDFDDSPGGEVQELQLRLCSLEPQPVVSDPSQPRANCCGLGLSVMASISARTMRLGVPRINERPLWVYGRTWRGRRAEEFVAGPLAPGAASYAIEVPAIPQGPSPFDAPISTTGRNDPAKGRERVSVSLCAFDAQSGVALAGASAWAVCDPLGSATLEARTWIADASGCLALDDLVEGTWRFVVSASGHAAVPFGPFDLRAADAALGEIDLGAVQLPPVH